MLYIGHSCSFALLWLYISISAQTPDDARHYFLLPIGHMFGPFGSNFAYAIMDHGHKLVKKRIILEIMASMMEARSLSQSQVNRYQQQEQSKDGSIDLNDIIIENGKIEHYCAVEN
ncbi:hypothetical protein VNO77_04223 [Canavalia gladiata]|uniref:Uncharacterized protein n=1 Tax=Canavalia gladiata TaxID=3824 RepID=A0AAN9N1A7_CANGL